MTNRQPPVNSCRPSVDVLFSSVSRVYGLNALGLMLTGMGRDGLNGARDLVDAGGQMLAQDEASSVVWGMPGEVARAELASRILPLNDIGAELVRRLKF